MDCSIMNRKIQMLLQETDTAFTMLMDSGEQSNADYADFTAKTHLGSFRSALQNPELSQVQLAAMLRRAQQGQQSRKSQHTYWSAFMASYVSRNANSNQG